MTSRCLTFDCQSDRLSAVAEIPQSPHPTGVLIAVGGPQYRVGSHRQFVLLARALAAAGYASMRFDYRGMGDSEGESRTFESTGLDLAEAVAAFRHAVPEIGTIVVWGLCDAASAALLHLNSHELVTGMVLLNPWVRTDQGRSRSLLTHYYLRRVLQADTWRQLFAGSIRLGEAWRSLRETLHGAVLPAAEAARGSSARVASASLPERMAEGLARFRGRVLFILSGDDLTAAEFKQVAASDRRWRKLMGRPRAERRDLAGANHTFSTRAWRDQVAAWTIEWLRQFA